MENNNSGYIFLRLKERNGEYEYYQKSAHIVPDTNPKTTKEFVEEYARDFYPTEADAEDGGYYFQGGELFVEVDTWQFISEAEFYTLTKYI